MQVRNEWLLKKVRKESGLCTVRFKLLQRTQEKSLRGAARKVIGKVITTCGGEAKSSK